VPYSRGTPAGVLSDVVSLPFNDAAASRDLILRHGGDLAAILVDPMPNRAGLVPAEPDYLAALRQAADEVGAILILDEVITFRLGYRGAQGLFGVRPDLTAFGKIIGGGFPVGAVGGRADVMAVFDPSAGKPALPHGGTFSANPVTMRAGEAAMRLLDPLAFEGLDTAGDFLRREIDAAFVRSGLPGRTTGLGSLLKVHFTDRDVRDYRSAHPRPDEAARLARFIHGLLDRGVIAASYGLMALSTAMSDADLEELAAACAGAIRDVAERRL
jgi:glutamate-1-semialdehyde 2,1-aminomutase